MNHDFEGLGLRDVNFHRLVSRLDALLRKVSASMILDVTEIVIKHLSSTTLTIKNTFCFNDFIV